MVPMRRTGRPGPARRRFLTFGITPSRFPLVLGRFDESSNRVARHSRPAHSASREMALEIASVAGRQIRSSCDSVSPSVRRGDDSVPPQAYRRQHLVTKAILRQFADPIDGKVECYDIRSDELRRDSPGDVCWFEFFIRDEARESERLWGDYERRLGYLYSALASDELLDNERAMNTVRAILALHAARSHTVAQIAETATRWSKERVARELVINKPNDLAEQIRSRTAYEVPITTSLLLDEAHRAVERNSEAFVPGGSAFRERSVRSLSNGKTAPQTERAGYRVDSSGEPEVRVPDR